MFDSESVQFVPFLENMGKKKDFDVRAKPPNICLGIQTAHYHGVFVFHSMALRMFGYSNSVLSLCECLCDIPTKDSVLMMASKTREHVLTLDITNLFQCEKCVCTSLKVITDYFTMCLSIVYLTMVRYYFLHTILHDV